MMSKQNLLQGFPSTSSYMNAIAVMRTSKDEIIEKAILSSQVCRVASASTLQMIS
jgi:hypothetical protein